VKDVECDTRICRNVECEMQNAECGIVAAARVDAVKLCCVLLCCALLLLRFAYESGSTEW